jgi:hypothetical protein
MKIDKILEYAAKDSFELLRDMKKIFAVFLKIENLPDQLVGAIESGEVGEHAGKIAFLSGVNAFCLSQLCFALAVKIFRIDGFNEKSIHDILSITNDLEKTEKT